MHTAHRKRTHRKYKRHWSTYVPVGSFTVYTYCGKRLPRNCMAKEIPEITCKVCQSPFRYWQDREAQ